MQSGAPSNLRRQGRYKRLARIIQALQLLMPRNKNTSRNEQDVSALASRIGCRSIRNSSSRVRCKAVDASNPNGVVIYIDRFNNPGFPVYRLCIGKSPNPVTKYSEWCGGPTRLGKSPHQLRASGHAIRGQYWNPCGRKHLASARHNSSGYLDVPA